MFDWSDGVYELTAKVLERASERAIEAAALAHGEAVLDVGCGTGNAALMAARRGARVSGVDPAARLLEVARARASGEGLEVSFVQGEAGALPFADGSFDAVVSVFAVIFAPEPGAAVREMLRVLRPGGRLVMTSWKPEGGIAAAGRLAGEAMAAGQAPAPANKAPPRWGDPAYAEALFAEHGARVEVAEQRIEFTAESASAWFDEQAKNHPAWRFARAKLGEGSEGWASLRQRSIEALSAHNLEAEGFRTESGYLQIVARR